MPVCVMNCKSQTGVEVFKVQATDYTGLLAVNWNTQVDAAIKLDFVLLGLIPSYNYRCNVTEMWFPSISVVITQGYYTVWRLPPNGNMALKVSCKKPFEKNSEEEEKEARFLY